MEYNEWQLQKSRHTKKAYGSMCSTLNSSGLIYFVVHLIFEHVNLTLVSIKDFFKFDIEKY